MSETSDPTFIPRWWKIEVAPRIEKINILESTITRLEMERDETLKLFHEAQTAIDRMKTALRRHKCQDPGYHLKDLYDLADRTTWIP